MSAPLWQAGHLYLPGDLVQPIQSPAPASTAITNPGFESGSTNWTLGAGMSVDATKRFSGTNSAKFTGTAGNVRVEHDKEPVAPGTSITASCMYAQGAADASHNTGRVILRWYTSGDAFISENTGNLINSSSTGWQKSTVTATAPATAAKVAIGCLSFRDRSDASWCDQFEWNYATQTVQAGLIYQAVQASPGYSGSTEPAWPSTLGQTVVDNEVTWEAVATSRVTWTASPILQSGTVEPTWPTTPGEFVSDGTISWECISRRVEDENCPNTTVVAIMAGKVFAADGDIVRFSATSNPLDWTSEQDAGFLPTGLQQANANDMAVLAPYRANLAAFNANGFQSWQVDPDPAAMAQLDQMEGIGSTWTQAAQAVGNELFFLSALGVRTVGISAGAENLAAGDVGEPIDVLVQDAARVTLANGGFALAAYYPGAGQYWLTFPNYPVTLSVTGNHPDGEVGVDPGATQYAATGGVLPYVSYAVASGSLPTGRTLNTSTGAVTGTPTAGGNFSWTISVTDANGSTATVSDSAAIAAIAFLVAPDATITDGVYTSLSGTTWGNHYDSGLNQAISSLLGANDRVFAFANGVANGRTSSDIGVTWVDATGFSTAGKQSAVYAEDAGIGRYLVFMANGADAYTSTDGVAFSSVAVESRTYYGAAAIGSTVVVLSTLASLIRSTDGGQTFSAAFSNGVGQVELVAASATAFVALGDGLILRSTTGGAGSWVQVHAPAGVAAGLAYGNGRFVVLMNDGTTHYSVDDGLTWATGGSLATFTSGSAGNGNHLAAGNGLFVAVGATQEIHTSPDAVTWVERQSDANPPSFGDIVAARYVP